MTTSRLSSRYTRWRESDTTTFVLSGVAISMSLADTLGPSWRGAIISEGARWG